MKRRKKGQKKRAVTLAEKSAHAGELERERQAQAHAQEEAAARQAQEDKRNTLVEVLDILETAGLTWGDLVLFVSDPANARGQERYHGLFGVRGRLDTILNLWVSWKNSRTGRRLTHAWAVEYVSRLVNHEANKATRSGILQSRKMSVNEAFALSFNLGSIHDRLRVMCPCMTLLMHEFSMTPRQKSGATAQTIARNDKRMGACMVDLLGERSQNNSYMKHVLGLYLYATGAQRQVLSVLSHLGLCSSYPTLVGTRSALFEGSSASVPLDDDSAPMLPLLKRGAGLLARLSLACRLTVRHQAKRVHLGYVYDNINMVLKVAEQILGRKDSQENGTCATAFALYDASPHDMRTSDLIESHFIAPPLSINDIVLSPDESLELQQRLQHTALRLIVQHGGQSFGRFRDHVHVSTPTTDEKIPLHKTDIYPLPAMDIDESTTTGNAEVMETIFREVGLDMQGDGFADTVKLIFGDQLSIARLRSLMENRVGHDSFHQSYLFAAFGPGFFHNQMIATHAVLETHWGSPSSGSRNPGCLSFQNVVLNRKPIVLSSLPPYRTTRDLIFVSLSARLLHCLELVCGYEDLEEYAAQVTYEILWEDVGRLVARFANPDVVTELREAREEEALMAQVDDAPLDAPPAVTTGDMIFENAVLFLRDGLVLREFTDAIKTGDSGRIITILKVLALMYRGTKHAKYAHELLFLIHNLTHVWPKPLRNIIVKNWLVNPTGNPNSWVPIDLLQEHMNFWIKTVYKAHGSNASWEWLETIAPCINILRQLATEINGSLGAKQGTKHHIPDLTRDITELKKALRTHRVYHLEPGRVIDGDDAIVPNIAALGFNRLAGPLSEYNELFARLKARRLVTPLVGPPLNLPGAAVAVQIAAQSTASTETPADVPQASAFAISHTNVHENDNDDTDEETYWAGTGLELDEETLLSLDAEADVALDGGW
ncbi:hypothetical protein B0H21DRAFT_787435 [Amylocystis lapponica]|nr:hypothetical protein B0H21DRAFT_787435 [Amylocystis lapponica]